MVYHCQYLRYRIDGALISGHQSVCVRLKFVGLAVEKLQGTSVVVACVVGFHEGTQSVSDKVK